MKFGVYIHFPFCRSKCGYCDFSSHAAAEIPHQHYAEAVLSELKERASDYLPYQLCSIYLGGGTPSLWNPQALSPVLAMVKQTFSCVDDLEITLEVNPGTIDLSLLQEFRCIGINRVSIGIQALDDSLLRLLTRIHSAEMALSCFQQARQAGFQNISCDLIFGIPGQTLANYLEQLHQLIELRPSHISTYGLTLAPESPLCQAGYRPVDDDLLAEMMEAGRSVLHTAGFLQYEVSNYAPAGWESAHNSLVWQGYPYLGLGASAHSMLTLGCSNIRIANPAYSLYLMDKLKIIHDMRGISMVKGAMIEEVPESMARYEMMFLGLRTIRGVNRGEYQARFGADPLAHYRQPLATLSHSGLVEINGTAIAPTAQGIWHADTIALHLLT